MLNPCNEVELDFDDGELVDNTETPGMIKAKMNSSLGNNNGTSGGNHSMYVRKEGDTGR